MCILWIVLMVLVGGVRGTAASSAASAEGCVAVPTAPCSYVATQRGEIDGGSAGIERYRPGWSVDITRQGRTIRYTEDHIPFRVPNTILPGDHVTAEADAWGIVCFVPGGTGWVRVGPNLPETGAR